MDYKLIKDGVALFPSKNKQKKYMALIRGDVWNKYAPHHKRISEVVKSNGVIPSKKVFFGDATKSHYRDDTGLGVYSHLNHLDKDRRNAYYKRHKTNYHKYSADYLSKRFLWSKKD